MERRNEGNIFEKEEKKTESMECPSSLPGGIVYLGSRDGPPPSCPLVHLVTNDSLVSAKKWHSQIDGVSSTLFRLQDNVFVQLLAGRLGANH